MATSIPAPTVPLKRPTFDTVRFGDFNIICASRQDLVDMALYDCAHRSRPAQLVFDANGHALSLARTDRRFGSLVQEADIIHADGGFLVSLSKRLKLNAIPERSATTDMLHDFSRAFENTGFGFYLLGSEERVNSSCTSILQEQYKGEDFWPSQWVLHPGRRTGSCRRNQRFRRGYPLGRAGEAQGAGILRSLARQTEAAMDHHLRRVLQLRDR